MGKSPKGIANIILILIIVILIGVVGFFVFQNSLSKQESSQVQTDSTSTSLNLNANKQTYVNEKYQFSFDYPEDLKPLELSNGVVTFLPEDAYDACKAAQGSNDIQAFEPCHKAVFNFNGFEINPSKSYDEHTKDIEDFAKLSTIDDDRGRTWNTSLVLGQVYNFNAFSHVNSTPIKISFQYGFNAPSEEEILSFFSRILSTFKFVK